MAAMIYCENTYIVEFNSINVMTHFKNSTQKYLTFGNGKSLTKEKAFKKLLEK